MQADPDEPEPIALRPKIITPQLDKVHKIKDEAGRVAYMLKHIRYRGRLQLHIFRPDGGKVA